MTEDETEYEVAYYGCGPLDIGHYWWRSLARWPHRDQSVLPAWIAEEADGGLQPKGRQVEGLVRVHRQEGWTALAWWDRSMDKRTGSCSVLALHADVTYEEALRVARLAVPWVFERMQFELREGGHGHDGH